MVIGPVSRLAIGAAALTRTEPFAQLAAIHTFDEALHGFLANMLLYPGWNLGAAGLTDGAGRQVAFQNRECHVAIDPPEHLLMGRFVHIVACKQMPDNGRVCKAVIAAQRVQFMDDGALQQIVLGYVFPFAHVVHIFGFNDVADVG